MISKRRIRRHFSLTRQCSAQAFWYLVGRRDHPWSTGPLIYNLAIRAYYPTAYFPMWLSKIIKPGDGWGGRTMLRKFVRPRLRFRTWD